MKSSQTMSDAMKGVTKAMRQMNSKINLPQIQKIMMDFEKESDMMDMKEEMMTDAIDDVMESGGYHFYSTVNHRRGRRNRSNSTASLG